MSDSYIQQLTLEQTLLLARSKGILLMEVKTSVVKVELYYVGGYFMEINYRLELTTDLVSYWRAYARNCFPDTPAANSLLEAYLDEITLPVLSA